MIGRNTEMIHLSRHRNSDLPILTSDPRLLNFLNGGLKACGQLPAIVELKGPFI